MSGAMQKGQTQLQGNRFVFLTIMLISTFCWCGWLWNSGPPGVTGEWTWGRVSGGLELIWSAFAISFWWGISCSFYIAFERAYSRWLSGLLLCLVALTSSAIPFVAQANLSGPYGHTGAVWVVHYPSFSGYYEAAVSDPQTTTEWLASYDEELTHADFLHQGTHPPGLILLFRGLNYCMESSPLLRETVLATQSQNAIDGFEILIPSLPGQPIQSISDPTRIHQAVIWSYILLVHFSTLICFGGVWICGWILRPDLPLESRVSLATRLAMLSTILPSLTLFFPKSDVGFAAMSVLIAATWLLAVTRKNFALSGLTGVLVFAGMICSLAFLPVVMMLGLFWLIQSVRHQLERSLILSLLLLLPAAGTFASGVGILMLYDHNLLFTWQQNYLHHAEFYVHNTRHYAAWLPVNLIELVLALGLPLVMVAVSQWRQLYLHTRHQLSTAILSLNMSQAWMIAVWGIWGLLWISGKNMGEAARLWSVLLPLLLTGLIGNFQPDQELTEHSGDREHTSRAGLPTELLLQNSTFWTLIVCQFVCYLISLLCVDGFHFDEIP